MRLAVQWLLAAEHESKEKDDRMNGAAAPVVRDHIFIRYRRDDARGASGRLYDWVRIAFGAERVFRDVHSIGVGKWRDKIDAALALELIPQIVG